MTRSNGGVNGKDWNCSLITLFRLLMVAWPDFCNSETKYSARIVSTAYGSLRGIVIPRSGSMPRDVEAFLGIPYASAPAASLRFMPPLTPSHFPEIRVADNFGPVCPQLRPDLSNRTKALAKMPLLKYTRLLDTVHLLANQSEDCLYLNVYLPSSDDRGQRSDPPGRAIVVVLHGDSWDWGSGSMVDGSALASLGNIVVVTLNYRIGILGFLQTSSQQGNFALMDIVAGLNWIRENGASFGGDPNRVTLLGHKTGAVLANFLMLAPVATELFHRVILLSGSALSPWSFQRHAKANVRKIAQVFNCLSDPLSPPPQGGTGRPTPDIRDLAPCLRDVPLDALLSASDRDLIHPRFIARLGPLVDGTVIKGDFVSEMKHDPSGHFSRIPLLIGTASIEAFDELNTEDVEDGMGDSKRDRILRTLVRNIFVFHLNEIYSTVKNEYTDWEKPRKDFIDVRDSILNVMSDGLTVSPLVQLASSHSARGNAKTYFFHFQYEPDQSVYPHRIGSISEDLLEFSIGHPILGQGQSSLPSYSVSDSKASSQLMRYLSNFIISGDPNVGYDPSTSGTQGTSSIEENPLPYWDSYDPVNQLYLEFGHTEPSTKNHYRGHKMALWLNLIPQLHQSGGNDVTMLHHNFKEEKPDYYEGTIREQSKHPPTPPTPLVSLPKAKPKGIVGPVGPAGGSGSYEHEDYDDDKVSSAPTISPATLSSSECPPNATGVNVTTSGGSGSGTVDGTTEVVRQLAASHYHSYGTALGVTIGIGCCLLLLNFLVFLVIFHYKSQSVPLPPKPRQQDEDDEQLCLPHHSCSHPHHQRYHQLGSTFPYSDDDYEHELIQELRSTTSGGYVIKDCSGSSGFCSPPIPDPPPPPRSSIPPSLAGSMVSLSSTTSGALPAGATGILRRGNVLPPDHRDTESRTGSMKKRVQIQEISV